MLLNFFATCNKIGAFTLGGGYAMIPIMEREFVDKNKWMDKQEFMDIMVVAQTTPGIFAIDMASHIGYKLKGVWGGIVGAIGIALPSIIAILIIAMFFQHFKDNYWVAKFFAGVRPAVVALIAAPCFKMAKTANINKYNFGHRSYAVRSSHCRYSPYPLFMSSSLPVYSVGFMAESSKRTNK